MLDAAATAQPAPHPRRVACAASKVVTTIEGWIVRPRPSRSRARGNYFTARVADPARLTQMRIGESIVVTMTEAVAISLEKQSQESG